jgi:hypothetical protein
MVYVDLFELPYGSFCLQSSFSFPTPIGTDDLQGSADL